MIKVSVNEMKAHFSAYLKKAAEGETILVCRRGVPVAEVVAIKRREKMRRPIRLDKGRFTVPDEFFDPLPEDLLEYFDGRKS